MPLISLGREGNFFENFELSDVELGKELVELGEESHDPPLELGTEGKFDHSGLDEQILEESGDGQRANGVNFNEQFGKRGQVEERPDDGKQCAQ
jgi:hypothetical protein